VKETGREGGREGGRRQGGRCYPFSFALMLFRVYGLGFRV
jgi:hypothetical protein